MMLADMGAEVIKIEAPGSGDESRQWGPPWVGGESAYYLCVNRNKKSVTLNLKDSEGRHLLLRLVERADVLVENFKVGTMERLGLGYETLRKLNPGLVYCSITGFGPDGPYKDRPGYDFIVQAMGGIMSVTGEPDGQPMKVGVAIVDITTGMFAAYAIVAALRHRDRTGLGQRIDVSLLESQVAWLANVASNYLVSGEVPRRYGNAHPNIVPYQTFTTADGWIAVAVGNDRQFARLCSALGLPELAEDPRFATNPARVQNREQLVTLLEEIFLTRDTSHWYELLLEADIPVGPINTVDKVLSDPQVLARGMVQEVPHPTAGTVKLVGPPYKLSQTPARVRSHPPLLGEHTAEVLEGLLGLDAQTLAELRARGVV
jgi:formyl-CoA transferase